MGIFCFMRFATRRHLRILCYHNLSIHDNKEVLSDLFMPLDLFLSRIDFLLKNRYSIVPLQNSLESLSNGTLASNSVVITFDDGFYSVYRHAVPILIKKALPATIFVTTYYCLHQKPIFRLLVKYMFWETKVTEINLPKPFFIGGPAFSIHKETDRNQIASAVILFGETNLNEAGRSILAQKLGDLLEVPYQDILISRIFSIMSPREIRLAAEQGIDIQLHTHRHRFPLDGVSAVQEIRDNRAVLEPLVRRRLTHFCYPSGNWDERHFSILARADIQSAVTCESGFNYSNTPKFALKRFLDSSRVSAIEFEAEMCGVKEIFRWLKKVFLRSKPSGSKAGLGIAPRI